MNKSIISGATLLTALFLSAGANATVTAPVTMTFQSGATFSGNVTFANDYSYVTDVTGILTGYQDGISGYTGSGSVTINWVWASGFNFSSGTDNYSTFLMDGPGSGYASYGSYSNWIQFAYNYTSAPTLLFTSGMSVDGTDNFIDYNDPMVSGTIGLVPEPETYAMLLAGLGLLGFSVSRRKQNV